MGSQGHAWTWESVPQNTFTPQEPLLELLQLGLRTSVTSVMTPPSDKAFLIQMLLKESANELHVAAKKLTPRSCSCPHWAWLLVAQEAGLWAEHLSRMTDLRCSLLLDEQAEEMSVLVTTPSALATTQSNPRSCPLHPRVVVVDNAQRFVWQSDLGRLLAWLSSLPASSSRTVALTSPLLRSSGSLWHLDRVLRRLRQALPGRVEAASELVSILRYIARPSTSLVQYLSPATSTPEAIETAVEAVIARCRDFLSTHRHSLLDIYGEEFRDLIEDIPDPATLPLHFLDELACVLSQMGVWSADRAALLLMIKIDKLKTREKYERHFLLLSIVYSELAVIRKLCEDAFGSLPEKEKLSRFSKPKLLRLRDVLAAYKPEHIGRPVAASSSDKSDKSSLSEVSAPKPGFRRRPPRGVANLTTAGGDSSDSARKSQASQSSYDYQNGLCGLVLVKKSFHAKILYHFLRELSRSEVTYSFLMPQYTATEDEANAEAGAEGLDRRKQEEALRRFRMRESNVLVSSCNLEVGIESVRCNLVVAMDPLESFVAFVNAKVKAKGPRARLLLMVEEGPPTERMVDAMAFFAVIEDRFRSMCSSAEADESKRQESRPSFIYYVNRYCAKLPSDTFTRLMPRYALRQTSGGQFVCGLQLPINSPVKETVVSAPMASPEQAKEAAAAEACRRLRQARELDEFMQPMGKDSFHAQQLKAIEASGDASGDARPAEQELPAAAPPVAKNTNCGRQRQYYNKQVARCLTSVAETDSYFLYSISMRLTCAIPEEQNTRGRKIFPPELSEQSLGFLVSAPLPPTCPFPIYTRSGEVLVDIEHLEQEVRLDDRQLAQVLAFHKFTFTQVLRLEKYPMSFGRLGSENSVMVVPLRKSDTASRDIDWGFLAHIERESDFRLRAVPDEERAAFVFDASKYEDAVVMPWYRNHDQPQYFYVAEICTHLGPKSAFPGQGFETFEKYYTSKYSINIQNVDAQPLLDVDHTSARLNFLTPRYVNRKGVALPTSSEQTKRNKRENLDQKQILVPELCAVHPFRASLWRQAVCLPCVFYRMNGLLLAEQLRAHVAVHVRIGSATLAADFRWQPLDFGWTLAEVLRNRHAIGGDSPRKEATPVRTIPPVKRGEADTDESDLSRNKGLNVGEDGDMNALADQIIHRITEEDQKLKKKKTLEIGMWSNEMASSKSGDVPRTGSRGVPVSDEDDDDDAFDIDMFDPTIALPDNLTLLSHPIPIQAATGGRDWGTGIQQKKFRVGSPTFFSNPNINIPGVVDDMDGYSCSDSSDQEYASEPEEEVVQDMSGNVRIEFRGDNMAEAIEDVGEESKRAEIMAREREEESRMVEALSWAEWEGDEDAEAESELERDVATMRQKLCAKKDFLIALSDSTNPAVADGAESQSAGLSEIEVPEFTVNEEIHQLSAAIHDELSFVCDSASIEHPCFNDEVEEAGLICTSDDDLQSPFSFDLQPDLSAHPGPSPSLILQALTMSNSNDAINLERLETIGDSFLKYAITAYLYCVHESVHEGRLSHLRSKQVSNVHLCRLGKARNLGESMVASKFEPHDNWLPPCYHVPRELEQALIESGLPATHWNMADLPGVDRMSKDEIFSLIREKTEESVAVVVDEDMPSFVPYNLLTQHSIPDKSIADCAEALIGAYLIACGPLGALRFMTWLGIEVLPPAADALPTPASPMANASTAAATSISSGRLDPRAQLAFHLQGYDAFEAVLGYRFRDRSYLLQAFCHASYFPNRLTDCYQRLEFLGDAVLDYLVTRFLYEDPRKHSPGTLTDLRSALVNNTIFATLAVKFQFHKYFKHFSPGLQQVINRFVKIQAENNYRISDDHYLIEEDESEEAEDIEVPKALGDVFESVAGAIFLDSGLSLDAVWAVYHRMMREEIERFSTNVPKSPIRELLELEPETAKFGKPEKLADGRRMRVVVEVFGKGVFKGIGRNYRIAKCTAAKCALRAIRKAAANSCSNAAASKTSMASTRTI